MAYRKHFLNKVIVRADFLSPILGLKDACPKALASHLARLGSICGERKEITGSFELTPDAITSKDEDRRSIFTFLDKEHSQKVSLAEKYVYVEYDAYESFDKLKDDFEHILNGIEKECDVDLTISRLGLRYIDILQGERIKPSTPLKWNQYVNKKYLGLLSALSRKKSDGNALSRVFSTCEYNYPDMRVRLNFGIHNPDYPQPISQNQFIIDTDIYTNGATDSETAMRKLPGFHSKAMEVFEGFITDELRGVMNARNS